MSNLVPVAALTGGCTANSAAAATCVRPARGNWKTAEIQIMGERGDQHLPTADHGRDGAGKHRSMVK